MEEQKKNLEIVSIKLIENDISWTRTNELKKENSLFKKSDPKSSKSNQGRPSNMRANKITEKNERKQKVLIELQKSARKKYLKNKENQRALNEFHQIERGKYIEKNKKQFILLWDDINFGKDEIKINSSRIKTIIRPLYHKGIFESLNDIKKEYFIRLLGKSLFKVWVVDNSIIEEISPSLKKIFEAIQFAKEYYDFKYTRGKSQARTIRFEKLSNEEILNLFQKDFDKSIYLKFLQQSKTII